MLYIQITLKAISFCFIVRISLPEVPPKVTGYGKIAIDIVTGIILPTTDELTDIISGVRYIM